jgi:hypothetical protein
MSSPRPSGSRSSSESVPVRRSELLAPRAGTRDGGVVPAAAVFASTERSTRTSIGSHHLVGHNGMSGTVRPGVSLVASRRAGRGARGACADPRSIRGLKRTNWFGATSYSKPPSRSATDSIPATYSRPGSTGPGMLQAQNTGTEYHPTFLDNERISAPRALRAVPAKALLEAGEFEPPRRGQRLSWP